MRKWNSLLMHGITVKLVIESLVVSIFNEFVVENLNDEWIISKIWQWISDCVWMGCLYFLFQAWYNCSIKMVRFQMPKKFLKIRRRVMQTYIWIMQKLQKKKKRKEKRRRKRREKNRWKIVLGACIKVIITFPIYGNHHEI